jgi:predicted ATP-dependent protease
LVTAVLGAGVLGALVWWIARSKFARKLAELEATVRELQKDLFHKDREYLAKVNELEQAQAAALRDARASASEEGRQQGMRERDASCRSELDEQRRALKKRCEGEVEQAKAATREQMRNEYELQTKLFSVKISPYVCVRATGTLLNKHVEAETGYQYQLLVNGIPAFAPHIIVENSETRKELNAEVEKLLLGSAQRAASAAIDAYLGGSRQFAKLAEPIIKRLPRP